MRLGLGEPFRESDMPAALDRLKNTLEDEGLYQAKITYRLVPHPQTQQMDIIVDAVPGQAFFSINFRIGDYSTVVLDPDDALTFWAANEYIGNNGASDIWRTHITSFNAKILPQISANQ